MGIGQSDTSSVYIVAIGVLESVQRSQIITSGVTW